MLEQLELPLLNKTPSSYKEGMDLPKNIGIVLGRGIDGVGCTKSAVEFQKLYPNVEIFATVDKEWSRRDSMPMPGVNWFSGADWDTTPRKRRRYEDILNTSQVLERLNKLDVIVMFSIPSRSHSDECIENFSRLVEETVPHLTYIQTDHLPASIRRNANLERICNAVDSMQVHSFDAAFPKIVKTEFNISTPIKKMSVGMEFNKDLWVPIEEQRGNLIRWVGRTAMWKNPHLMIELQEEYLKDEGFITVLEGIDSSVAVLKLIYRNFRELEDPRNMHNYFRPTPKTGVPYGEEKVNEYAYVYPQFNHADMIERMRYSGFGVDLYQFPKNIYGNNVQYALLDVVIAGSVPIMHKHHNDCCIHRKQGVPISECKDSGTVSISRETIHEQLPLLKKLATDTVMRDEWRNMAYEFYKEHADADIIYKEILSNTLP